jgi:hypothetical protein
MIHVYVLLHFICSRSLPPGILAPAQAEPSSVFSDKGLPNQINHGKLPCLNAVVSETQNWCFSAAYIMGPFSFRCLIVADEEVLEYRIPKGTLVVF